MYGTDLNIIKFKNRYALAHDGSIIRTAGGSRDVSHYSPKFLDFLREDLVRCGQLSLNEDRSLDFRSTFCAYAIFSDQEQFYAPSKSLADTIKSLPLFDLLPIQVANGPPAELEEIKRLTPAREKIEQFLGQAQYQELSAYCWAQSYRKFINEVDYDEPSEEWGGPGVLISKEDFLDSNIAVKIYSHFRSLTVPQQAAVHAIFVMTGRQSFLLTVAFISNWLTKSEYVTAALAVGGNILNFVDYIGEDSSEELQVQYDHLDKIANLAIEYIDTFEFMPFGATGKLPHESSKLLSSLFHRILHEKAENIGVAHYRNNAESLLNLIFPDYPYDLITENNQVLESELRFDFMFLEPDIDLFETDAFRRISENGQCVFFANSYKQVAGSESAIKNILEKNGLFLNAAVQLPPDFLDQSTYRQILCFCSRYKHAFDLLFIAELEPFDSASPFEFEQASFLAEALITIVEESDGPAEQYLEEDQHLQSSLWGGIYLTNEGFLGFEHAKIEYELSKLETDYSTYISTTLGEIATSITPDRGFLLEHEDAFYLPVIGSQPCCDDLASYISLKHQNICQIIVDRKRVAPAYLASFFNTLIGKKQKELALATREGATIPRLSRGQIRGMRVAIPPLEVQEQIIEQQRKITQSLKILSEIRAQISLNPLSSEADLEKLELIYDAAIDVTISDRVKKAIVSGETKTVEFKQTFSWDIKKQVKAKYIIESSLKTIAAFLNTSGGTLIVGVDDERHVTGLEEEIDKLHKGSKDKFNNNFKDNLKVIGPGNLGFVDQQLVNFNGKVVLLVDCQPAMQPVFIDNVFYVRSNPATDKLEGSELLRYTQSRFNRI